MTYFWNFVLSGNFFELRGPLRNKKMHLQRREHKFNGSDGVRNLVFPYRLNLPIFYFEWPKALVKRVQMFTGNSQTYLGWCADACNFRRPWRQRMDYECCTCTVCCPASRFALSNQNADYLWTITNKWNMQMESKPDKSTLLTTYSLNVWRLQSQNTKYTRIFWLTLTPAGHSTLFWDEFTNNYTQKLRLILDFFSVMLSSCFVMPPRVLNGSTMRSVGARALFQTDARFFFSLTALNARHLTHIRRTTREKFPKDNGDLGNCPEDKPVVSGAVARGEGHSQRDSSHAWCDVSTWRPIECRLPAVGKLPSTAGGVAISVFYPHQIREGCPPKNTEHPHRKIHEGTSPEKKPDSITQNSFMFPKHCQLSIILPSSSIWTRFVLTNDFGESSVMVSTTCQEKVGVG